VGAVIRGVIFDGDDTLWLTEHLYDEARDRARAIVEQAGLDGDAWERAQRRLDVENVAHLGHDPSRFPTSAVQALHAIGADDAGLAASVEDAARSVFRATAPLRDHAVATLESLRARGLRRALLTKGDPEVQARRIDASGLRSRFDVIEIVAVKTPADFEAVAARLGLQPDEVVSVGNSVRSDIEPSLAAGITPVWIPAYVWEYEHCDDGPPAGVPRIQSLDELAGLIEELSPASA